MKKYCRRTTTFEPVPLDFHLYSVSSIFTEPLLKGGQTKVKDRRNRQNLIA